MNVYFIGPVNSRGTYYFYSKQLTGWIVADMDIGKASLHNKLATVRVIYGKDEVTNELEALAGLGQEDSKWLVDGDDLLLLLRDYPDQLEVLLMHYPDGDIRAYGKMEVEAGKALRKLRKIADND